MKITWVTDDTVRVEAVITDFDGTLLTPTSHSIIFYNPSGSAVGTTTTPTNDGTGTYRYDYVIGTAAPKGIWKISWKILSGTYPARETINFNVAEG
jgi:uncharacterized protein YfaS (alpha-2-macroglobulin family)